MFLSGTSGSKVKRQTWWRGIHSLAFVWGHSDFVNNLSDVMDFWKQLWLEFYILWKWIHYLKRKNFIGNLGCYKFVSELWFEGFRHTHGCVRTQTKEMVKLFSKINVKNFLKPKKRESAMRIIGRAQLSVFPNMFAMLYLECDSCMDFGMCML